MKNLVRQESNVPVERRSIGVLVLTLLLSGLIVALINFSGNAIHRHRQSSERTLETTDDDKPHFLQYAYVFVVYHKSGHELSHTLRGYLQEDLNRYFGTQLEFGHYVDARGSYDASTKCTELALAPGTITVIEAPELQCHEEQLAKMMMHNPYEYQGGSPKPIHPKRGVKLIHLVRNPFTMVVSNYHYHAQDPTPEPFVHLANPCASLTKHVGSGGDVADDLEARILEHPSFSINGEVPSQTIMDHQDFDNIIQDCQSFYQTRPGFEQATYYEHLRKLDPKIGIRLSTADKFNHIALMAGDLLMFNRVREYQRDMKSERPWIQNEEFDLLTMTMDDWIAQPGQSMYNFLQFIFHDTIHHEAKVTISKRYEQNYFKKMSTSPHITSGKHSNTEELIEYLRRDKVYGGPLTRIEDLLNEMLHIEQQEILSRGPAPIALSTKREMTLRNDPTKPVVTIRKRKKHI